MEIRFRIKDGEIQLKAKYLGADCKYHLKSFRINPKGTEDISYLTRGIGYLVDFVKEREVPCEP